MELSYSFWIMIIASFIFHVTIRSYIMASSLENINLSISKIYMAIIMALLNGVIVVVMFDLQKKIISGYYYLALILLITFFIYLYRNQIYITDKEYLKDLIENLSTTLGTSEEIIQKTKSEKVKRLAENFIESREKEINYMKQLLKYNYD